MKPIIYFYPLTRVQKKTGKHSIWCKIEINGLKSIYLPIKQSRNSKTLATEKINFISKNGNYLCVSPNDASLINLTIINYQDSITKGVEILSRVSHPITKEVLEGFIFNDIPDDITYENPVISIDDIPDILTGNYDEKDADKLKLSEEEKAEEWDIFNDDTGKLQKKKEAECGESIFVFDYLHRYIKEIDADSSKKSALSQFQKYVGNIHLDSLRDKLHRDFLKHLKDNPKQLINGNTVHYSAGTLSTYSKAITAFANWLDNKENINYDNKDIKVISIKLKHRGKKSIIDYAAVEHTKQDRVLEINELIDFLNFDASGESKKLRLTIDFFRLQLLMGGVRFKTIKKNLKKENIQFFEGNKILKTDSTIKKDSDIQMIDEAIKLCEKYDYNLNISLGYYNKMLRKIGTKLNWNRNIFLQENIASAAGAKTIQIPLKKDFSSHYARHTAVSYLASKGYSIDRIVDITKHTYETVRYYMKFYDSSRKELQQEFANL